MKRLFVVAALLAAIMACAACQASERISDAAVPAAGEAAAPEASASGEAEALVIRVTCEEQMDLGKMLSWMYEQKNADVDIEFAAGSLSGGIDELKTGDAQAALYGLNKDELSEYAGLKPSFFYTDGIAIIVNPGSGVDSLSAEQLKGIFTGAITDWSEVGGEAGRITVYAGQSPHIRRALEQEFGIDMDESVVSGDYAAAGGDCGCAAVESEAGGISFASLATVIKSGGVKAIGVGGAAPTAEAVLSGAYPLRRDFYLMAGEDEQTGAFINFCLNDTDAAAYVYDKGYIRP